MDPGMDTGWNEGKGSGAGPVNQAANSHAAARG